MLQKMLDYTLESCLPTKLSILIAGSSISLAALAIGLPEYLQKMGLPLREEKTLLLRIVAPLTLLYLGTFIVLLLVMKHSKTYKKQILELKNDSNQLTLKYGVYWDREGNSYCPKCKTPTSQTEWATCMNRQFQALKCTCSDTPLIFKEYGEPVQAQEIMKRMKIDAEANSNVITNALHLP